MILSYLYPVGKLFLVQELTLGVDMDILIAQVRRGTMHPKFNLNEVRTHELQIMNSTFHAPETLPL